MADDDAKKVLLVADYGKNDLAFKEVTQVLYHLAQKAGLNITVDIVSVDPFNTAQTAAVVAQAAESGRYDMIYHNTAPRKDIKKARHNNDGEGIIFADYKGTRQNTLIVGVNSGNADTVNTSALLPAERIPGGVQLINCDTKGSQFRSRDVFPPHVIAALTGEIELKDPADIPQPSDKALVRAANEQAKQLLDDAYAHQLSRHGDASKRYVTVISRDSGAEALLRDVAGHHPGAEVDLLPLKSTQNQWIEAGFAAAQLALNSKDGAQRTVVILPGENDTLGDAPRLYEAVLDNGATLITSDLRTLTFARNRIVESRSSFTLAELDGVAKLPADITPAYTDGYGNIKLAIRHDDLLEKLGYSDHPVGEGERGVTAVRVNNHEKEAYVGNPNARGSFAVQDGEFALSSGSSGWAASASDTDKAFFAEIFLRGGNASQALGIPQPGDAISIQRKRNQSISPGTSLGGGQPVEAEFPATSKAKGA